jgi:hypothetical protein
VALLYVCVIYWASPCLLLVYLSPCKILARTNGICERPYLGVIDPPSRHYRGALEHNLSLGSCSSDENLDQ